MMIVARNLDSFSVDFITENRNGLLAFVGRYDDDFSDFISVEALQ